MRSDGRKLYQQGFTLIEVLVTLALLSVISLILFNVVSQQYRLIKRIESISAEAIATQTSRNAFREVVVKMLPEQMDDATLGFSGTASSFSGYTVANQLSVQPGMTKFSMQLQADRSELIYEEGNVSAVLMTFNEPARFSYMGSNGAWLSEWPPEDVPDSGRFDDSIHFRTPPLPVAIRITTSEDTTLHVVAKLGWQAPRPFRWQDLDDL